MYLSETAGLAKEAPLAVPSCADLSHDVFAPGLG